MKRLLVATALVGLAATACGKDAKPLVDAAEKYQKDVCACKDTDCVKKASDEYAAATKKLQGEKLQPSEEQAKKITDATTAAATCNTKIATEAASKAAGAAAAAGGE